MGFIKAAAGAIAGNLSDQWKEMFYCDSLGADTLLAKGQVRHNERTSNSKGDENIISNGSIVIVNSGQAAAIIEQGSISEFISEPGSYQYDNQLSPTIFAGNLSDGVKESFSNISRRFSFGGDTGVDQRVYYFNLKEIVGNKYGTATPIPFRVVDNNIGLDIDVAVRCNGEFSFQIVDPIKLYSNISGNVTNHYGREQLSGQLRTELLTALQPAFAALSAQGIRYSAIPAHTEAITQLLQNLLSEKWERLRGLRIVSFGINSIAADDKDSAIIKELQKNAVMRDPGMAAATLTSAQAEAMVKAADNQGDGGAFLAFANLGMAQRAGGTNINDLFQAYSHQPSPQQSDETTWLCFKCGTENTGKFCKNCGQRHDTSKVCSNCGHEIHSNENAKFCPECGHPLAK